MASTASRLKGFLIQHRKWVAVAASSVAASVTLYSIATSAEDEGTIRSNFSPSLLVLPRTLSSQCEDFASSSPPSLRARQTLRKLQSDASSSPSGQHSIASRYNVDWKHPLGRGSFGVVYMGIDTRTQERVAIKKISQHAFAASPAIQLELQALVLLQHMGGHPNICSLRESYSERGYFYLVLDLIEGCEMFDYLVDIGIYSEADAARLIREATSAVAYLHGLGVTHGDMKPENLMLSSMNASDAVVKLIDFGCALIDDGDGRDAGDRNADNGNNDTTDRQKQHLAVGKTIAYCPPEALSGKGSGENPQAADMWALGVILYIMLTGTHPFDMSGEASDKEVADAIVGCKYPPLRNSALTSHLSDSAIDLIEKLLQRNPAKRLNAHEMLEHPWTRGLTASQDKMIDASKKLAMFKDHRIAEKVFGSIVEWSDDHNSNTGTTASKISLVERAFRSLDPQRKGYLTKGDLRALSPDASTHHHLEDETKISLSDFSHLLADFMADKYFPRGHVIYREGDIGEAMYFINSGNISVQTAAGSKVTRGPGDFFGEGALFHPQKLRSATISCDTPVHAIEISRSYFERVVAQSDPELLLTLLEKDKIRKRNRAKMILGLQSNLVERKLEGGDPVFKIGETGDSMFLVQDGKVRVHQNGKHVFTAKKGNVFGEYSVVTEKRRNSTAVCDSKTCLLHELNGKDFRKLCDKNSGILTSMRDLCLRREFKKAVVLRLKKEFPYDNPREAFNAVRTHRCRRNQLDFDAIAGLMRELNPDCSNKEIHEIIETINLSKSGTVTYDEFKKVFIADIQKSKSI